MTTTPLLSAGSKKSTKTSGTSKFAIAYKIDCNGEYGLEIPIEALKTYHQLCSHQMCNQNLFALRAYNKLISCLKTFPF